MEMDILEINNRLKLKEGFAKYLEEAKTTTTTYRHYGLSSYCPDDNCECKFYEWSDLTRNPKIYRKGGEFFEYLDKCNITYTPKQKSDFNIYYRFFATCMPGNPKLILTRSLNDLETIVNKINSGEFTEKDIPYGSTIITGTNTNKTNSSYNYYDDWD